MTFQEDLDFDISNHNFVSVLVIFIFCIKILLVIITREI